MMTDTDQNFFQVKSGEPVPPMTRGEKHGRGFKYPFPDMEVGQHFDAPDDMGMTRRGTSKRQDIIASCYYGYVKRHAPDAQFVTRKLDGIIRCWRVA